MSDRLPNLVQRAAERLRQPTSKTPASGFHQDIPLPPPLHPAVTNAAHGPSLARTFKPAPSDPPVRSVTISPAALASNGIALPSAGLSRTLQEFRALKRELIGNMRRQGEGTRQAVLVTSPQPADGKTFTATNLALVLAYEKETRVLLMDADAYRQSLIEYLGITADHGWLDVVAGSARIPDVLLGTNLPNLDVLPAGRQRDGIPELMSSSGMRNLLDELVRQDPSRIIIIDSVPCLTSTEPSILAGLTAQTLLVVAAHQTARDQIEASLRVLKGSPNINLVLNKAHPSLTEQFKGYGYTYASADKAS